MKIRKLKETLKSDDILTIADINKMIESTDSHYFKFRHAKATSMVREGYNEAIIRKLLGWTATSSMLARYQHLNDTDIIDAALQISSKKKREENPPEKLNEAKPLSVIETAGHLFQVEEDNRMILENNKNMDAEVTGLRTDVEGLNEIVELQE